MNFPSELSNINTSNLETRRTNFSLRQISNDKIDELICSLENRKSPGYDNINSNMLMIKKT